MQEPDLKNIISFRRRLHTLAELSNKEKNTAAEIKSFLSASKPDSVIDQIGGHGLAAVYSGKTNGPTVMIRCELDAVPVPENIEMDYASVTEGVAHKCGHDGHMAIVCGLASWLAETQIDKGRVVLLFQPAEETGEGAARVLQDEKFNTLEPDYIFALHNLPGFPEGDILIKNGVFASASCGFIIRLKGKTSHAGHPEGGKSPALAAAALIQHLTALPSMHTALHDAALVTVIHVRVGEVAFGTSPGYAEVMATLRAHRNDDLELMTVKAKELAKGIASAHGLEHSASLTEIFEANINDPGCVELITEAAEENGFRIQTPGHAFPWSEDFGRFTQKYKGALFGLGAGLNSPQLHNGDYDFNENLLSPGIKMFRSLINNINGTA